jgi:hypothetical protein
MSFPPGTRDGAVTNPRVRRFGSVAIGVFEQVACVVDDEIGRRGDVRRCGHVGNARTPVVLGCSK